VCRGSACSHLYVSNPVVYPDALGVYEGTEPATVVAWLFPVTDDEAEVVRTRGWSHFEDLLEAADVDLLDLERSSIVA
jgi:hypothetical protein